MRKKTLLAFISKSGKISNVKTAIDWVQSHDWHLKLQVLGVALPSPVFAYGVPPGGGFVVPEVWREEVEADAKLVSDKVAEVEKALQAEGISADVINTYCEKYLIEENVGDTARVSDLAILPNPEVFEPEERSRILGGLLFSSPIAVIVNAKELSKALEPQKVFIAWDTSLQASRAVHHALPMLQTAEEVIIAVFDPVMSKHVDGEGPGEDVAEWLSRQDCKVTVQQYPSGGKEIGEIILKRAVESGADLVVMGAYGHSRMRQRIFGGTTQTMLAQDKVAVLMAH